MEAEQIKAWREARGWSLRRLGEELGINYATISRWESGATRPPGRWLDLALEALEDHEATPTQLPHPPAPNLNLK